MGESEKKTEVEYFNPRGLRLEFRRIGREFWECRVAKQQPFGGAHAWARTKGMAREHVMRALRGFTAADAKNA